MTKKYFTSDWHIGEQSTPNTHSYLRHRATAALVEDWIEQCRTLLRPEDTLVFVGDVGITLDDLTDLKRLPVCRKILILGDKECANKHFSKNAFLAKNEELQVFHRVYDKSVMTIADRKYFLSHKPLDCMVAGQNLPALCGHVHGIWRSQLMPKNSQPIINVGIDAWGGLVSEDFIEHQYNALLKFYDANCFPAKWQ